MNWSLVLNVLLLMGVVGVILRILSVRRQERASQQRPRPAELLDKMKAIPGDDIIAVRKLDPEFGAQKPLLSPGIPLPAKPSRIQHNRVLPQKTAPSPLPLIAEPESPPMMLFLRAKPNRQLVGYELLQAILSAGFRFGEGDLFHRHQSANGQGPVLCSLAAATATGTFDLQNIGGFTARGLCLFMHLSGNVSIDTERFDTMIDAAKTLSDDLDTELLDDRRQALSKQSMARYHERLSLLAAEV